MKLGLVCPDVLADLEGDEEIDDSGLTLERLDGREGRRGLWSGRGEREGVGGIGRANEGAVGWDVRRA